MKLSHPLLNAITGTVAGLGIAVAAHAQTAWDMPTPYPANNFHTENIARFAADLARNISGPSFRAYTQTDIIGVEVGGAVKNVIAIATGIADGLHYGANTRVALITRGLAEMMRPGSALGARRETFMGLAGLGALVLPCTDDQSRNRRFGMALGRGGNVGDAQREIAQVVEGVRAAQAVMRVGESLSVEMPICREVHAVIHEHKIITEAVQSLMSRAIRAEGD